MLLTQNIGRFYNKHMARLLNIKMRKPAECEKRSRNVITLNIAQGETLDRDSCFTNNNFYPFGKENNLFLSTIRYTSTTKEDSLLLQLLLPHPLVIHRVLNVRPQWQELKLHLIELTQRTFMHV